MSTFESIIIVVCAAVAATVLGNLIFSAFAEWKNPPIGKFVECDGIRIHYLERGNVDAPAVVLLHGNGTMIQDFMLSGLVDLLAREYRVICFDRPGFGYTSRPRRQIWTADEQGRLLQDALNQLAVRNPVVLGHSWGTLVAIALACRADYPVAGLVLASGYYFPTVRFDVWMLSAPAIPVLGDLIRYTVAPIISAVLLPSTFRTLFSPRAVPTSFRTQFPRSLMLRPKQLRAAAEESALLVPTALSFQSRYPSIKCPIYIFHGAQDAVIECQQSRDLQRALPGKAHVDVVENAGHMVTHADSAEIAQAVKFINSRSKHQASERGSYPAETVRGIHQRRT
jgi:pimeloyl-ACP methyl ester carboxylesterase